MSSTRQTGCNVPFSLKNTEWDIGSYLRYEQERPDVVSLSCDCEGDVPVQCVSTVLHVLQGDYPRDVYLAELPQPGIWTRKLKLFAPGLPGRLVTIIGGGAPRLWLGNEVAYLLPNPRAKYTSTVYRHFLVENHLFEEKNVFEEAQGGLARTQAKHIQDRMAQAQTLIDNNIAVPAVVARGKLSIPGWEGSFLAYNEGINFRPEAFLDPGVGGKGYDRKWGIEVFRAGVKSLFQTLRKINVQERGMFHGDLVHRIHGGSANYGFTLEGEAVLKGWGRRLDERVNEWSAEDFHRQQMEEVTGALAGLVYDIMNSNLRREDRGRLMIDVVRSGLEAYTGHYGKIDRVTLTFGLPTELDRLRKRRRGVLNDYDIGEHKDHFGLHQESGQLPDEIRNWLVQCVVRFV